MDRPANRENESNAAMISLGSQLICVNRWQSIAHSLCVANGQSLRTTRSFVEIDRPRVGSMSAFFAPHRPRVGGSMTESYTAVGQVLRSSEKACLRSPASRERNTRQFDSASVSARVEKSCWLGRSQPGVSLAFNHLPTDAGSVVKDVFQYVSFWSLETSCVFLSLSQLTD